MFSVIFDIIESIFELIFGLLVGPFDGIKGIFELIYGGETDLAFGIFTLQEIESIYLPGMNAFVAIAIFVILISIILAGMKISSAGINPANRTYVMEFFRDLAIVGLIFFNLATFYQLLFGLNYIIVDAFSNADEIFSANFHWDLFNSNIGKGVLGALILGLLVLGLTIWANWYYIMRKLTLLILMIMGPLMVSLYLIPQTRSMTHAWFKELVGTTMVQSVHAVLFWVMALISSNSSGIESIILYATFIPIAETLRSLLGLGSQMDTTMSKAGAMFGMAGLAGMSAAIKGALDGRSVGDVIKGIRNRGKEKEGEGKEGEESDQKPGVANNAGTDIGSTSRAERMLRAGQILSKGGKAVFGAAGAIAGTPMGPLGAMAGSTVGFHLGGAMGGLAGRTGAAAFQLAKDRLGKGLNEGKSKFQEMNKGQDEELAQSLADAETTKWANENKDAFMKKISQEGIDKEGAYPDLDDAGKERLWQQEVAKKHAENLDNARQSIAQLRKSSGNMAKATDLVNATADNLTNEWAKQNEANFKKNFDAKSPTPTNETERQQHEIARQKAWEHEVQQKRNEIHKVVSSTANQMSNGATLENAYLDKNEFAKNVSANVGSIVGDRTSGRVVQNAVSGVKAPALIRGRSVNQNALTSQLAAVKTAQAREQYISSQKDQNAAAQHFDQNMAKQVYQSNLSQLQNTVPKAIQLSERLSGGGGIINRVAENRAARFAGAVVSGVGAGVMAASGITGMSKAIQSTKVGGAIYSGATSLLKDGFNVKNAFQEGKQAWQHFTPTNVVQKQATYRNAIAYAGGLVFGVGGHKAGATIGAKFNPFNREVNRQTAEIAEIQQMVQTKSIGGETIIPQGALRMVQSRDGTVIQVRDKAGQIRTVSRIGSGDSTLKKGQVVYQDLTIQGDQLVRSSNVYVEDSGGGRIGLNRTINVNPNRLVANRNTPKTNRVVYEVDSYNQFVDSGEFTQKEAIKEVTDIRLVVTRNNSFLVGKKDGKEVRISPYGKGDARLQPNAVAYRTCDVRNNEIVTVEDFIVVEQETNKKYNVSFSNTIQPRDLLPKYPPNPRLRARKSIEQLRNKSFTEPLR